jgi:ATP-dependent exoDNAse (exonuclease V) beta subunit
VHRALANWNKLSLPENALETRLIAFARREGIVVPQAVHHAVRRTMEMLDHLRRTDVYAEIDAAVQRLSEVPFTLTTPIGQMHGVIDLLFKDRESNWHLVDWKTDWFPEDQINAQALEHARQIAIYAAAARNTLGVEVNAMVCFLAVRSTVYTYSSEELIQLEQLSLADVLGFSSSFRDAHRLTRNRF